MNPVDYTAQFSDPVQDYVGGFKAARMGREVELQEQAIAEQERMKPILLQRQQRVMDVMANPNATLNDYRSIIPLVDPKQLNAITEVYKSRSDEVQRDRLGFGLKVMNAYEAGADQVANGLIKERLAAMEGSGGDPKEIFALKQTMANPRLGRMLIGGETAAMEHYQSAMQGKQTEQTIRDKELMRPLEIREKEAKIRKTDADIALEAAKYNLGVDEYNLKVAKAESELSGSRLPSLGAKQIETINEQAREAEGKIAYADQAAQLAQKMITLKDSSSGGIGTKGVNAFLRAVGAEGQEQAIRDQYDGLRSRGVIQRIPKGLAPMSNTDLDFIQRGFPPANADPEYIAGFMNAFSKAVKVDGLMQKASAGWENSFGTIPSKANRDIELYGVVVPKGASFDDFQKSYINSSMPTDGAAPAQSSGASYMSWGRKK